MGLIRAGKASALNDELSTDWTSSANFVFRGVDHSLWTILTFIDGFIIEGREIADGLTSVSFYIEFFMVTTEYALL